MAGSFKSDILPMFRDEDIQCMAGYGVPLDNYKWMSKNAKKVYDRLTGQETPQMPDGGPYWDDGMLKKFNDWMTVDPKLQP